MRKLDEYEHLIRILKELEENFNPRITNLELDLNRFMTGDQMRRLYLDIKHGFITTNALDFNERK